MLHNVDEVNKALGQVPHTEHRVRFGNGVTIAVLVPLSSPGGQEIFFGELSLVAGIQVPGLPFKLNFEKTKWVRLEGSTFDDAARDWFARSEKELQEFQREVLGGPKIVVPGAGV